MSTFSANGKLLITSEYFVLEGAKALAVPVKFGQQMKIINNKETTHLVWKSYDQENKLWFSAFFKLKTFEAVHSSDEETANTLTKILAYAQKMHGSQRVLKSGKSIETYLNFPREWGLGTSSTLIHLVAQLFDINPFLLNRRVFGGSGYDIACASAKSPITFQLMNDVPIDIPVSWHPRFSVGLFFIYLGKKQNSREGIAHYRTQMKKNPILLNTATQLTKKFLNAETLIEFENLIFEHEKLVQSATQLERAKDLYFSDYWGEIKSLGAWGGDFILATSNRSREETKKYFSVKGFSVFFCFDEMVLSKQ